MSEKGDPIARPRDREKALSAAYLRHLGATQAEAASATGIDPRTLGRWEGCRWWASIQEEAASRWLCGLAARARVSLGRAVDDDGRLALSILERLMPALAPPRLRATVEAADDTHLLATAFWRYVMALHLHRGMTIAEAQVEARREPEKVNEWGREHGLLPAGEVGGPSEG